MNIMLIILIITVFSQTSLIVSFQVRVRFGLPNHAWQDKRSAIAKTVDYLGDEFRPAMCSGWLAYIKNAYGNAAPAATSCKDQGTLVVEDDDC